MFPGESRGPDSIALPSGGPGFRRGTIRTLALHAAEGWLKATKDSHSRVENVSFVALAGCLGCLRFQRAGVTLTPRCKVGQRFFGSVDRRHSLTCPTSPTRRREDGFIRSVTSFVVAILPTGEPWSRSATARTPPISGTALYRSLRIGPRGARARRGLRSFGRSFRQAPRSAGVQACVR